MTVLLTDGHSEYWKCSGPPYTPSACEWWALPAFFLLSISKFKKNHLDLYLFFQPNTKSHLWRGSLPPLLLPPHYIFFWNRENSQDVSAGWHEWVPTVLTDLLEDLFFAWELHIWPRMIILGSVLVEIIGRSHLKKSDWLACLFNFNPLSPSQSNYHYVVYSCAFLQNSYNPFIGGICSLSLNYWKHSLTLASLVTASKIKMSKGTDPNNLSSIKMVS